MAEHQSRQQPRLDELRHRPLPFTHRPPEKCRQRWRKNQQQPENLGVCKAHGSLLKTVCPSAISVSKTANPTAVNQLNNSVWCASFFTSASVFSNRSISA